MVKSAREPLENELVSVGTNQAPPTVADWRRGEQAAFCVDDALGGLLELRPSPRVAFGESDQGGMSALPALSLVADQKEVDARL